MSQVKERVEGAFRRAIAGLALAILVAGLSGGPLPVAAQSADEGGVLLVYELDSSAVPPGGRTPELAQQALAIVAKRLDALGVTGATVRLASEHELWIMLPEVPAATLERVKDVVRRGGDLWFKVVVERDDPRWDPALIRDIEERKARGAYVRDEEEFDTAALRGGPASRSHVPKAGDPASVLLLMNDDAVDGRDLAAAEATRDSFGGPAVKFFMKPSGRARLADTTEKYQGHRLAIVLDGVAVTMPTVRAPIPEGTSTIEGTFTQQEVEDVIVTLQAGALPVKPILKRESRFSAVL